MEIAGNGGSGLPLFFAEFTDLIMTENKGGVFMNWNLVLWYMIGGIVANLVFKIGWFIIAILVDCKKPELLLFTRLNYLLNHIMIDAKKLAKDSWYFRVLVKLMESRFGLVIDILLWPILPFVLAWITYEMMKIDPMILLLWKEVEP